MSFILHLISNREAEVKQLLQYYLKCCISYQQDNWTDLISLAEFAWNNAADSPLLVCLHLKQCMAFTHRSYQQTDKKVSYLITHISCSQKLLKKATQTVKKFIQEKQQIYKKWLEFK